MVVNSQFLRDWPDWQPPFPIPILTRGVMAGSTTIFGASTLVVGTAANGITPILELWIVNTGTVSFWVVLGTQTQFIAAAVGRGILLNPNDVLITSTLFTPTGVAAISTGANTIAGWTVYA